MIKDLVHADPLPAEQQNGQLTAVLTPLDVVAKAVAKALWDNEPHLPFTDAAWERELKWWRDAKEDGKRHPQGDVSHMWFAHKCYQVARAVLLALEEVEIPDMMPIYIDGFGTVLVNSNQAVSFRAIVRALASPNDEGKANED